MAPLMVTGCAWPVVGLLSAPLRAALLAPWRHVGQAPGWLHSCSMSCFVTMWTDW